MSGRTYEIKNKDYYCPQCAGTELHGKSEQVCEDGCEMWLECPSCGLRGGVVDTVWGWDTCFLGYAYEEWQIVVRKYKKEV